MLQARWFGSLPGPSSPSNAKEESNDLQRPILRYLGPHPADFDSLEGYAEAVIAGMREAGFPMQEDQDHVGRRWDKATGKIYLKTRRPNYAREG